MIAVVERLKEELRDQPANPLRLHQVQEYQGELTQLAGQAEGRDLDGVKRDFLAGAKGAARRRIQQIEKVLADQTAKKVTGERANQIHADVKETLETVIRPAMLPRSALRRNPPGAVGHLLRTEFNPAFKDAVLAVKRGLRALDPDNADPDFTNMERFRPEGLNPDGTSTFMADAQIPGAFAMTPAAKANWPLGPPTVETALAGAKRRAAREAPAAPAKQADATKRPRTAAQIAAVERMKAGLAAKLAGKEQQRAS